MHYRQVHNLVLSTLWPICSKIPKHIENDQYTVTLLILLLSTYLWTVNINYYSP